MKYLVGVAVSVEGLGAETAVDAFDAVEHGFAVNDGVRIHCASLGEDRSW